MHTAWPCVRDWVRVWVALGGLCTMLNEQGQRGRNTVVNPTVAKCTCLLFQQLQEQNTKGRMAHVIAQLSPHAVEMTSV